MAAAVLALMFATKETAYIVTLLFLGITFLLGLPDLSGADAELDSAWQTILAAQAAYTNYRSKLISTSAIDTWDSGLPQPLFSDAGQAQLATELASAFASPAAPVLGETITCSPSRPCFPDAVSPSLKVSSW